MIRRVGLILAFALGILVTPLAAEAQPAGKTPKLGYLSNSAGGSAPDSAFMQGLQDLGWVDRRTIVIEARYTSGQSSRLPEFARDLVGRGVDVIVGWGPPPIAAAKQATNTIPIVGILMGDPVGIGWATSLARPGGNVTGIARMELAAKRMELLKEIAPRTRRLAILGNPTRQDISAILTEVNAAARLLDVQLVVVNASSPDEIDGAFVEIARRRAAGLVVLPDPMFWARRAEIVELAAKSRLPAIYWSRDYVEVGGLLSYAESLTDLGRRAAAFVDKILKGAKPADLPVELPTRFELVVNRRTAKALGLTIPPSILIRADHVIE